MSSLPLSMQMLVLSTLHLSAETRERLEKNEEVGCLYYPKGPWGWFCRVCADDPSDEDTLGSTPEDLKACITYARSKKVHWIMLDDENPVVSDLPVFRTQKQAGLVDSTPPQHIADAYARHLSTRLGRTLRGKITDAGKIKIEEDREDGLRGDISVGFALSRIASPLPLVDFEKASPVH